MCDLSNPRFHNEDKARAYLEDLRWPHGPVCPHCGDNARPMRGKSMGKGWYYCSQCQDKFTVRVGTVFERSKVPLHKWCMAMHLMASSKKGVSAHQLHRMLGVTYKTAWFIAHRIREAMSDDDPEPMGGSGKSVQADETYFGKKADQTPPASRRGRPYKSAKMATQRRAVFALVSEGKARTFQLQRATVENVREALVRNVSRDTELHTDESNLYPRVGREFAKHRRINHSTGEYVGKDGTTTNNVENYFSVFKRGMEGVYQHCSEKHLHRYLAEFDFRYNHRAGHGISDADRAAKAALGAEGKRLTYRRADLGAHLAA